MNLIEASKYYNETHRYYHNLKHLQYILDVIHVLYQDSKITSNEYNILVQAAIYHDIVYNPKRTDNETKSIEFYLSIVNNNFNNLSKIELKNIDKIVQIINDTKHRTPPIDKLSRVFWEIDNSILLSDFKTLLQYEDDIFKEYQFVSYQIYKEKRIEFLNSCLDIKYFQINKDNILRLIDYINYRKIHIGLYAGSFAPITIGHKNIYEKAEKIFDKVILLVGQNSDKVKNDMNTVPSYFEFKQVEYLDPMGLTTDFIQNNIDNNVDISLIRGLRNGTDLQYEQNQLSYMKDFYADLKVVYITCDKEFEHISSSVIRSINKINPDLTKRYLI